MKHFYVILNKTAQRIVAWGAFDPNEPEQALINDPQFDHQKLAHWAVAQPLGFKALENGTFFWIGEAPNLEEAVKCCRAETAKL